VPTWTFKIGEAFPADDPVARFVTVLAMMSNDWHRSVRAMNDSLEDDADGQGTRLLLFRQQVAYHHEATKFLTKTRREYPEVDRFLDGLDADASGQYDTVIAIDAELETWQANNRNVTFHYPTMVRARYENGAEEIANALGGAATLEGTITAADGADPRFGFADAVAVNLVDLTDRDLIRKLSTTSIALTELVYAAVKRHLESLDPSVFRIDP
jgi:hypothetical protein